MNWFNMLLKLTSSYLIHAQEISRQTCNLSAEGQLK